MDIWFVLRSFLQRFFFLPLYCATACCCFKFIVFHSFIISFDTHCAQFSCNSMATWFYFRVYLISVRAAVVWLVSARWNCCVGNSWTLTKAVMDLVGFLRFYIKLERRRAVKQVLPLSRAPFSSASTAI